MRTFTSSTLAYLPPSLTSFIYQLFCIEAAVHPATVTSFSIVRSCNDQPFRTSLSGGTAALFLFGRIKAFAFCPGWAGRNQAWPHFFRDFVFPHTAEFDIVAFHHLLNKTQGAVGIAFFVNYTAWARAFVNVAGLRDDLFIPCDVFVTDGLFSKSGSLLVVALDRIVRSAGILAVGLILPLPFLTSFSL